MEFKIELENNLNSAIDKAINRAIEEETEKAKLEVERRIREEIGTIALGISDYYSFKDMGKEILITVRKVCGSQKES